MVHDLERAKAIQGVAVQHDLPDDPRVTPATHYIPHAIVGGDYYPIWQLGNDQYSLLLFSDGAIEIHDAQGQMLDIDGLVAILRKHGYPARCINMQALGEELPRFSNTIRLEDGLTLVRVRFLG